MGRLIDADTVVHWQSYDDEYETFLEHEGTIAEFLDAMTDEGCPESVSVLPSAQQEAIRRIEKKVVEVYGYPKTEYAEGYVNACKAVIKMLKSLSPVDAISVVRCDDCIRFHPDGDVWGWCAVEGKMRRNDYCSYGLRKDGDHGEGTIQKERS